MNRAYLKMWKYRIARTDCVTAKETLTRSQTSRAELLSAPIQADLKIWIHMNTPATPWYFAFFMANSFKIKASPCDWIQLAHKSKLCQHERLSHWRTYAAPRCASMAAVGADGRSPDATLLRREILGFVSGLADKNKKRLKMLKRHLNLNILHIYMGCIIGCHCNIHILKVCSVCVLPFFQIQPVTAHPACIIQITLWSPEEVSRTVVLPTMLEWQV